MNDSSQQQEFRQRLNLIDSTMIVIGSMIGSGIFLVSADIARTIGSPGYFLLVWVITGAVTLMAALSYGELATMMPQAGGQYIYLREAYGPLTGFLYGWTLFLVIQTGTIAAVGIAFAKFTGVLIPWFSADRWILPLGTYGPYQLPFGTMGPYHVGLHTQNLLAISSIILLTYINAKGIQQGKQVQNAFTATKTIALAGLIIIGFFVGSGSESISINFSNMWNATTSRIDGTITTVQALAGLTLLATFGASMVGSLFSSDAWNNITFTAGEVINPKRNIPISLALGTGIVTILYLLANLAYLFLLPLLGSPNGTTVFERGIQFATADRVGTAAAETIFGGIGATIMALLIMISTFGCNNGLILAGARVYYAMARDSLFFKRVGILNREGVPGSGLAVQAIWAGLLCLTGTYSDMLDYVVFAVLLFYVLTIGGLFILRKRKPEMERPYRAFGYPIVPLLYILIAVLISIDLLFVRPNFTWPGLFIVLLGLPVYFIWHRGKKQPSTD